MLDFCELVNEWMKERYYKILIAILDRGELDLEQLQITTDMLNDKKLL